MSWTLPENDDWVPVEVEDVVELLLTGLRERDTVVRWSAAKGIGRVTNRLPQHLADEVVAAVLQVFSPTESDSAWHGGCLALAELSRRCLLLPDRLPTAVPLVIQALAYDVRKGAASVGAHVRDAACYVCWALARAYSPEVLRPYVHDLATSLAVAAVFDREVNGRRAASAAFQEHVGRQGCFPHGIDIVTKADYFSLCNRSNAFTHVAVYIAGFDEYRDALVNSVVRVSLRHWDKAVRDLAAQALGKLMELVAVSPDGNTRVGHVLDELVAKTLDADLATRHGATVGLAETVLGLSRVRPIKETLEPPRIKLVVNTVPGIEKARLYRGRGGEMLRGAVCQLLEATADGRVPLTKSALLKLWVCVEENLRHPIEDISSAAVAAARGLSQRFIGDLKPELVTVARKMLHVVATDDNPGAVRGFVSAVGRLPRWCLVQLREELLPVLLECAGGRPGEEEGDPESRRNATVSLGEVVEALGTDPTVDDGLTQTEMLTVHRGLMRCLSDYALDKRGDVGSWVRTAALHVVTQLMTSVATHRGDWLTQEVVESTVCAILQQSLEKIDRVRQVATTCLRDMLQHTPKLNYVPHRERLESALAFDDEHSSSEAYPRMLPLAVVPVFRESVVAGAVQSAGGLTESLAHLAWEALRGLLLDESMRQPLTTTLISLLETQATVDRVSTPVLVCLDKAVKAGVFDYLHETDLPQRVLVASKEATRNSKDMRKLVAHIGICCGLIGQGAIETQRQALGATLLKLGHTFPKADLHLHQNTTQPQPCHHPSSSHHHHHHHHHLCDPPLLCSFALLHLKTIASQALLWSCPILGDIAM